MINLLKDQSKEEFHVKKGENNCFEDISFLESNLIVRGLNSHGIKMSFIAKGALKSKRRFGGGVLDPCSFIEVEYQVSRSLYRVGSGWVLKDFRDLRRTIIV